MHNSLFTIKEIDEAKNANSIKCDVNDLTKIMNVNKSDLTILSQNIRSIRCNFDDLQVTLSCLSFDIDVLVLTECRLDSEKPIPFLCNYVTLASTNNLNQNDGVVVYVKKTP